MPPESEMLRSARILIVSAVGYLAILGMALGLLSESDPAHIGWLVVAMPIAVIGISVATSALLVLSGPMFVLSPIPWFYFVAAAYYGLGPLAFPYASDATINYIQASSHFPINSNELVQTNALNAAGMFLVTASILVWRRLIPWRVMASSRTDLPLPVMKSAITIVLTFAIVGGLVRYGVVLPRRLGIDLQIVPSFIEQLSVMLTAALLVATFLVSKGQHQMWPLLVVIAAAEFFAAVLSSSKLEIANAIIAVAIGRYLARPTWSFVIGTGVLAGLLFAILSPFILFVRENNLRAGGAGDISSLIESVELYVSGSAGTTASSQEASGVQGWWSRFVLSNFQQFAINSYDTGRPGSTLDQASYVLLPRVLFPDKPAVGSGAELSDLLYPGSSAWSQTSMGYFAEGYWNGGVAGLVLVCVWAGFAFVVSTRIVFAALLDGNWAMTFPAFLFVQLGTSIESWFVPTFIGGLALTLVYAVAVHYAIRIFSRSDRLIDVRA